MGQIQGCDLKTEAELVGLGADKTYLPKDSQIYVTANSINKTLDDAIVDGDLAAAGGILASKNNNYTVLDNDGYRTILVTVVNKLITLPSAASNTNRIITIIKNVSGAGTIAVKGAAAGETVDGISGTTGIVLDYNKESVTLQCTGSVWVVTDWQIPQVQYDISSVVTYSNSPGSPSNVSYATPKKQRDGSWRMEFNVEIAGTTSSSRNSQTFTISGITSKTGTNQAFYAYEVNRDINSCDTCKIPSASSTFTMQFSTTTVSGNWYAGGNIVLDSKPTFVV